MNKKQQAARIKRIKLLQQINTEKNQFEETMRSQNMEIMDPPVQPQVEIKSWTATDLPNPQQRSMEDIILRASIVTATIFNSDRQKGV